MVVDLGAEHVEAWAGSGLVRVLGLVEGELGAVHFGLNCLDTRLVGYAEEVGVSDREDDQVAGVLGGEFGGLKVVLGGHIALEGVEVDEVLGPESAKLDPLQSEVVGDDGAGVIEVG